jgi:hypothetical protein
MATVRMGKGGGQRPTPSGANWRGMGETTYRLQFHSLYRDTGVSMAAKGFVACVLSGGDISGVSPDEERLIVDELVKKGYARRQPGGKVQLSEEGGL